MAYSLVLLYCCLPLESTDADPKPAAEGHQKERYIIPSVMDKLQEAIYRFSAGNYQNLQGSSRTDIGVHAIRNTCHVDIATRLNPRTGMIENPMQIQRGINYHLQRDPRNQICVRDACLVDDHFDARFDASARTYMYRLIVPTAKHISYPSIFHQDMAWVLDHRLNLELMRHAAAKLVGLHDFASFRGKNCQSRSSDRHVEYITIDSSALVLSQLPLSLQTSILMEIGFDPSSGPQLELITVTVEANSFLKRMVRNMVAMLVDVGKGSISLDQVDSILLAKDRAKNPCGTAPAQGLFLVDVHYDKLADLDRQAALSSNR
jgi:tRNA pseudouridine38-40 synthase